MTNGAGSEVIHTIRYGYSEHGILIGGRGMGPTATSLSISNRDHDLLVHWSRNLSGVVVPEFARGEEGEGHWYRSFNGHGALVLRVPEEVPRDRRGGTAYVACGRALTPEVAFMIVNNRELLTQGRGTGWESLDPIRVPGPKGRAAQAARLERELLGTQHLVKLVHAVLVNPFAPVDVLVPDDHDTLPEHQRIVLLWGVYRTLKEVFAQVSEVNQVWRDWSFTTYDPWPSDLHLRGEHPRIAFRPRLRGAVPPKDRRPLDLFAGPLADDAHHDIARWLVERDPGTPLGDVEAADYQELLALLHQRVADEDRATAPPLRVPAQPETPPRSDTPSRPDTPPPLLVGPPEQNPAPVPVPPTPSPPPPVSPSPTPTPTPLPTPVPSPDIDPADLVLDDLAAATTPEEVEAAANALIMLRSPGSGVRLRKIRRLHSYWETRVYRLELHSTPVFLGAIGIMLLLFALFLILITALLVTVVLS